MSLLKPRCRNSPPRCSEFLAEDSSAPMLRRALVRRETVYGKIFEGMGIIGEKDRADPLIERGIPGGQPLNEHPR